MGGSFRFWLVSVRPPVASLGSQVRGKSLQPCGRLRPLHTRSAVGRSERRVGRSSRVDGDWLASVFYVFLFSKTVRPVTPRAFQKWVFLRPIRASCPRRRVWVVLVCGPPRKPCGSDAVLMTWSYWDFLQTTEWFRLQPPSHARLSVVPRGDFYSASCRKARGPFSLCWPGLSRGLRETPVGGRPGFRPGPLFAAAPSV